jgi:glycosyltransferase involved in cell wall biosynthesis
MKTSLSVLVPVYNEQHLVYTSLQRLKVLETSEDLERIQVIVVDDCSTDGTPAAIANFEREQTRDVASRIEWTFLKHERNAGKGRAVRTALEHATCEISVIHDADLEYSPKDLLRIVGVFIHEAADAVYGSRFAGGETRRILNYRHEKGNKFLTFLSNVATNLNLTDMNTCYKAVRTSLLKSIPIESDDFCIDPELTIKLAKRHARLFEVPVSYSGRTYDEGKKIGWRDGFRALAAIVRFTISDRIYLNETGSDITARLSRAPKFNLWTAEHIRKYCGTRVLELGSGTGNMTRRLIPRGEYVASDVNPVHLQTLEALSTNRPYMKARYCDITDLSSFPRLELGFDTVVCLNVIEHVEDDRGALENVRSVLTEGGTAIVLVPQGQWNFGTLDEVLGHQRRYTRSSLQSLAEASGFTVREVFEFNRIGTPAWFVNGKILRRRMFGLFQIWMLELLTPFFRLIDPVLPFPGLSLVAVLERREPASAMSAANESYSPAAKAYPDTRLESSRIEC